MTNSTATDTRSLADTVKPGDIAMLVTHHDGAPSSRPITVAKVDGDTLVFLVDRQAGWFADTAAGTPVHVAISASGRNDWVSLNGSAQPTSDRTLIDELWNPAAGAFFDGKDDPNIVVLGVAVTDGEYWSAPGGGPLGRLLTVVAAALGKKGSAGEHGSVS
ncbi:MAG: pyridoxamine 5'-phosphate oxidase family protein [Ilumatobacteraceae bacterium]